jgi:hypothetical protein
MKTVVAVALIFCLVKASFAQDIGGRKTNGSRYRARQAFATDFKSLEIRR